MKEIKYGKMPIQKYKKGSKSNIHGHYHVIVESVDDDYISVGLTSNKPGDKKNQKLHKVYESNGKIARLKSSGTIDKKNRYSVRKANFNVDLETEKKAIAIAHNLKDKKNNK